MRTFLLLSLLYHYSSAFLLDREVCYGDLGCFNTQTIRSLARPIVLLPDEPAKIGTRFFLYTRKNPTKDVEHEITRKDPDTLSSSHFNGSNPVKVIIHTFTHTSHEQWVLDMIKELLIHGDYNIISVDWRQGAMFPYTQATANIRVVAAETAKLLEYLFSVYSDLNAEKVHLIGHSLGAHTAGEVGTRIKRIGRISGLDPTGPYFDGAAEDVRLEKRDAEFVDVIHSDGSSFLSTLGMGYTTSIGHVDFYPNGGAAQPNCQATSVSKLLSTAASGISGGFQGVKDTFACSHERAIWFYIESINSQCPFTAYQCKDMDEFKLGKCLTCAGSSCSRAGFHADKSSARGNFFLLTNQEGKQPHCSYHYKVTLTAGVMPDKAYGKVAVGLKSEYNDSKLLNIPLTDKPLTISSNTQLERLVISSKDLGEIKDVNVTYTKDSCITCFLYSDFFKLQSVEITAAEKQRRVTFCGKNTSLATNQMRSFPAEKLERC